MASMPSLPADKLQGLKEEFCALMRSVDRPGAEALLRWLDTETDFFTAPASTQHHGAIYGGLLLHSLEVFKLLHNFSKPIADVTEETLIVCGLLHDLCKTNFYVAKTRNVKNEQGRWEEREYFAVEDSFPMGHGEKSVFLIMRHMQLTDQEALAIRWHMGGYDDAARSYVGGRAQAAAYDMAPLCAALNIADTYAAHFRS